jgi:hypothetical protein
MLRPKTPTASIGDNGIGKVSGGIFPLHSSSSAPLLQEIDEVRRIEDEGGRLFLTRQHIS